LDYSPSTKSFHLSNPFGFYLQGKESLDQPWVNLSYGIDYKIRSDRSEYDYYRGVVGIPTGTLKGTVSGPIGTLPPIDEIKLSGGTPSARLATNNTFSLTDAPTGVVELTVEKRVEVVNPDTGRTNREPVSIEVVITNAAPANPIAMKVDIAPVVSKPCLCTAWCGIAAATVGGVQTVVAGGGKFGTCEVDVQVVVTGPGGVETPVTLSSNGRRGRKSFSPAANGVWTVTTTICGVSKTCTVVLP
jgi:hypothetical protein